MSHRGELAKVAAETVAILRAGKYTSPERRVVEIEAPLKSAVADTVVYRPEDFAVVFQKRDSLLRDASRRKTEFQVTNETTLAATMRLAQLNGIANVACLNFASAKNPGGGFLGGSQAQEESLARASGLYACLEGAADYYESNRECHTPLYTHHLIYSPGVPVIRDDDSNLLEAPYPIWFITSPAVNAGAVRQNQPHNADKIEPTMRERTEHVLSVAAVHGHKTLVLGAWGCGVFKNEPELVAELFAEQLLEDGQFSGFFGRVLFAVLDHWPDERMIGPFRARFAS